MEIAQPPAPPIGWSFVPRHYQLPYLKDRANGKKRGVVVCHRRGGKDLSMVNMLSIEALKRVGAYYYLFPKYAQGKKIIWQGRDKDGRAFLDYIPREIIATDEHGNLKINETDMRIEFTNGSSLQIIGTDNIDSIVGTNPVGCVFSEYALQNPRAWDLIRPILRENGGWAWFVYTPRGRNHGYRLFKMAQSNPAWSCYHLTVNDTFKDAEKTIPVLTAADIQEERDEGMDEDLINQEYYCSFDGSVQGSYYGRQISLLYAQNRVASVPWDPAYSVYTAWDLGIGDSMAIWFFQLIGQNINFIDYYEHSGEGLEHYAKVLKAKDYAYEAHYMPHDARAKELGTGKSREEVARSLGIKPIRVAPRLGVDDGIQAVRKLFPRFRFDERACVETEYSGHGGLDCVAFYHKEWDEDKQVFNNKPDHDWSSHGADALRVAAVMIREHKPQKRNVRASMHFDVFSSPDENELVADMDFDPFTHEVA